MTEDGIRSSINPMIATRRSRTRPKIVTLLDSIPGAFERAKQGLEEIRSGKGIALEDL